MFYVYFCIVGKIEFGFSILWPQFDYDSKNVAAGIFRAQHFPQTDFATDLTTRCQRFRTVRARVCRRTERQRQRRRRSMFSLLPQPRSQSLPAVAATVDVCERERARVGDAGRCCCCALVASVDVFMLPIGKYLYISMNAELFSNVI